MEKIVLQQELFLKALKTLENAFKVLERVKELGDEEVILAAEDSIIQRFEYCYDSFWKVLKTHLETVHNLQDINSPRSVFRACVQEKIYSEAEGESLNRMIVDRNKTTHNYDAEEVREILPSIPKYFDIMAKIAGKILPRQP